MHLIKLITLTAIIFFTASIYSYQLNDIDGNIISLSAYQGKKILFVNTADSSPLVNQYASLEQLYTKFSDSLVIIAVPSNSFGNEPDSIADSIKSHVQSRYDIHYILASRMNVAGDSITPIYQWLTQKSENGVMNNPVFGDFFKYLVNEQGQLIGVFSPDTDPMDTVIQNSIMQ